MVAFAHLRDVPRSSPKRDQVSTTGRRCSLSSRVHEIVQGTEFASMSAMGRQQACFRWAIGRHLSVAPTTSAHLPISLQVLIVNFFDPYPPLPLPRPEMPRRACAKPCLEMRWNKAWQTVGLPKAAGTMPGPVDRSAGQSTRCACAGVPPPPKRSEIEFEWAEKSVTPRYGGAVLPGPVRLGPWREGGAENGPKSQNNSVARGPDGSAAWSVAGRAGRGPRSAGAATSPASPLRHGPCRVRPAPAGP
jgi:hypothetical protein